MTSLANGIATIIGLACLVLMVCLMSISLYQLMLQVWIAIRQVRKGNKAP